MGRYTKFRFESELENDLPKIEREMLHRILVERQWDIDENHRCVKPPIDHKFFDCPRWFMLLCYTDFDPDLRSRFEIYEDGKIMLNIHSSFLNRDGEIHLFLDWIRRYVKSSLPISNLGWYQIDEDEKIYIDFEILNRRIIFRESEGPQSTN